MQHVPKSSANPSQKNGDYTAVIIISVFQCLKWTHMGLMVRCTHTFGYIAYFKIEIAM